MVPLGPTTKTSALAPSEAFLEKIFAAERHLAGIRAAIIALNVVVYFGFMDPAAGIPWLAYLVTGLAVPYAAFVLLFQPYRRFRALHSAWFTSITDAVLITLWLLATGGFESPFFVLWYVSLAAVAFRFDYRTTMAVAFLYGVTYMGLLLAVNEFVPNMASIAVRVAYIFFVGMLSGLLSRETLQQTQAKVEMRRLMLAHKEQAEILSGREAELRQTVSTLNATLDSTADGILVVDNNNRITSFNRRFVEMWHIPSEVLESRNDGRAIGFVLDQLKDPTGFLAKVKEVYAKPNASSFDILDFKDGRTFERFSLPQLIEGSPVGRVWSFRDVTAQRQAEKENLRSLERAKELERLKELDHFKTQFINSVAHELWTPMTPIKLQLHMLRHGQRGPLSDSQVQAVDMIERNMDRLTRLVEEMLDSARLQAGRFRVQRVPMNLSTVVAEMVDLFHVPAREAGVLLTAQVDPDLPIDGDGNRLVQVMYNLLSNALKFTPKGGTVQVIAAKADGKAAVTVHDTGAGLTESQIGRLFQAFSQAHEKMEQTKSGTGLGLYISKAIVDAHGGHIFAESEGPGLGSSFTFTIALADPTASAAPETKTDGPKTTIPTP